MISPSGQAFRFEIDPGRKEKMLKGLDAIGETLEHAADIDGFEEKRRMTRAWAKPRPGGHGHDRPDRNHPHAGGQARRGPRRTMGA